MSFPVFDLHCDTALALLDTKSQEGKSLLRNQGHIDLERAGTLPGYAQCFACFTTSWEKLPGGITVEQLFERERDVILAQVAQHPDKIRLARSAEDVKANFEKGLMSAILTVEGPAGIGFDPARLEGLSHQGFRISTLTWNEQNSLAGSHKTGGGLTDRGREYVKEAQRLGILMDVSHLSDEAFWDMMDMTQAPIIATHSNSRAVWDVSRNVTDEMFRAVCQTGGVVGLNQYTEFLGDDVTIDTACDHILHFLELDPDGTHVALGGDLDGCEALPQGFDGVQDYPKLAQRLLERGLDEALVRRIFWDNVMEVFERCST